MGAQEGGDATGVSLDLPSVHELSEGDSAGLSCIRGQSRVATTHFPLISLNDASALQAWHRRTSPRPPPLPFSVDGRKWQKYSHK